MVGANKQCAIHSMKPAHKWPVKNVCLFGRAFGNKRIMSVAINLRRANKSDARIGKIAQRFCKKIAPWYEIGVYLGDYVIFVAILVVPRVMIAAFGFGREFAISHIVVRFTVA